MADQTQEPTDERERADEDLPLLDLSTATKRQIVEIDGEPYELKVMDDFGIADQQELSANGREYDRLWNRDKLNGTEKRRLKLLLDKMSTKVLDAPPEIHKKLSDAHRSQIVLAFTLAPLVRASEKAREETGDRPITETS